MFFVYPLYFFKIYDKKIKNKNKQAKFTDDKVQYHVLQVTQLMMHHNYDITCDS